MTLPRVLLVLATSGGGTGRHVAALARDLAAAGWPVAVAGPAQTLEQFDLATTGARVHVVDLADRPRPAADARAIARLRGLAREADVVHAHGVRAGALAVLAARSGGRFRRPRTGPRGRPAVLVTVHNRLVGGGRVAAVHAVLARVVARGADAVLGVSGDVVRQLRDLGARDAARAFVPAPARAPDRDRVAVRRELGVPDGTALLVTVARLAPQKGLDLLLDALHLLTGPPAVPGARDRREGDEGSAPVAVLAVVAGDGPLAAGLAASAADRRVPLVLLGRRDDVPDLLAAADIVVLPSVWEGQPLIAQEALRAGTALVATDVGGTREVTEEAALLVPGGDAPALARAVRELLADGDRRDRLRRLALERAAHLPTDQDALAQVAGLYLRLATPGRPGDLSTRDR